VATKPWCKVVTPREDLREGKPLDASEFAVHLDHMRDGHFPKVYQNSERFFERIFLTKNLNKSGGRGAAPVFNAWAIAAPDCVVGWCSFISWLGRPFPLALGSLFPQGRCVWVEVKLLPARSGPLAPLDRSRLPLGHI
jgi:hypothetical protein